MPVIVKRLRHFILGLKIKLPFDSFQIHLNYKTAIDLSLQSILSEQRCVTALCTKYNAHVNTVE